jgi:hypothetical protein
MEIEDHDQPTPAVDHTRLLSNIIRYWLSERGASRLALDAQFGNARFRAHHIIRLIEFVSTKLYITSSARAVARVFEVCHSAVKCTRFGTVTIHRPEGDIMNLPQTQSNSSWTG